MLSETEGFRCLPSRLPVSGQFDQIKDSSFAEFIKNEYRLSNHEYRMSKDMYSVNFKKSEQSETTLRHSAVRYSLFRGSLSNPGLPG